ncbi:hypothetical protein R5W24_004010 [Gemmata sp. JC717]|uniref:MauE/DoxX family redox-associated membrane protein n=1 Tax=Gemmata algarum TaxID=2975278 RepID=UPI0021BB3011|nr:MauE/DoxX family redox-associated membrane protein [Gemmata algarum]MDY3554879.1 hypothetical protein [Gemmata algarum]
MIAKVLGKLAFIDVARRNYLSCALAALRGAIGIFLIIAAVLKASDLTTSPASTQVFASKHIFTLVLSEVEVVLGIAVVLSISRRRVSLIATVLFAMFSLVAAYKSITGQLSCDCLGEVSIAPHYILIIDFIAVVVFAIDWRVGLSTSDEWSRWRNAIFLGSVVIATGIIAYSTVLWRGLAEYSTGDRVIAFGADDFIAVNPTDLVGKRFDLANEIDVGGQLQDGSWLVVFYRKECGECKDLIERLVAEGPTAIGVSGEYRICFVFVGNGTTSARPTASPVLFGRLNPDRHWVMKTPCAMLARGGSVIKVVDVLARR